MDLSLEKHFTRAANTYAEHAPVQLRVAKELCAACELKHQDAELLEFGCGTGFLSSLLLGRFPLARLTALDISREMLDLVSGKIEHPDRFTTICGDVYDVEDGPRYDGIVSSSALHWCEDLAGVFGKFHRVLKPKGVLRAAVMVRGTLGELHQLRAELFPENMPRREIPNGELVCERIVAAGFELRSTHEKTFTETHASVEDFLNSLRLAGLTGGSLSQGKRLLRRNELIALMDEYDSRFGNAEGIPATYRVLFVDATASV